MGLYKSAAVDVLIKGAGDLASGVAHKLHNAGMSVVLTELPRPACVRCAVSFSRVVYEHSCSVEGVEAQLALDNEAIPQLLASGKIAVSLQDSRLLLSALRPQVFVEATLSKRNSGVSLQDASCVIALGPGYTASVDCHAVIETMRGHDLGRVFYQGSALPDTGQPGLIDGYGGERLLRAPAEGLFRPCCKIGARVQAGQIVAYVGDYPLLCGIGGVLRGLLPSGTPVYKGMKSGDVDPRGCVEYCFSISDKARCVAGGVLEAVGHCRPVVG